ncbi:MAG TPA: hypothetical protein VGM90_06720 [Kofleriaceae bacterium]
MPFTSKLLVAVALIAPAFAACAVSESDESDIDVSIDAPADGKADAIDGLAMRLHKRDSYPVGVISGGAQGTNEIPEPDDFTVIDARTNQSIVITASAYQVWATQNAATIWNGRDPLINRWSGNHTMTFSASTPLDTTRAGVVLFGLDAAGNQKIVRCEKPGLRVNYFRKVTIDHNAQELYANDRETFTFAQCGIDTTGRQYTVKDNHGRVETAAGRAWSFNAYAIPVAASDGLTDGAYTVSLLIDVN